MKQIQVIDQDNNEDFTFYDNAEGIIINQTEGFDYPSTRPVFDDIPSRGGQAYITSRFGSRRFSWQGDIVSASVFTLRRAMLVPLSQNGTLKLIKFTTYDDLLLQCLAEITKVTNPYTHSVHSYLIEATAPDWRFYSQELKQVEVGETINNFGTPIPTPIPMDFSGGGSGPAYSVENEGTEITDPIITVTGPGSNFKVSNTTTGQDMFLDVDLEEDDELVIDVLNKTIILNGEENDYAGFSGEFWSLIPGDNVISFAAISGGSSENTKVTFEYRDAYRGI